MASPESPDMEAVSHDRHLYQTCTDDLCDRFPCRVYKEGHLNGHEDGFAEGYNRGYSEGYGEGYAAGFAAGAASAN